MSYVVSFSGYRPGVRYDDVAWTTVRIEEAAASNGPWAAIDTQALVPDVDPALPSSRDLTTDQATLAEGWYRLVWVDPAGGEQPTAAVYSSPSAPAAGSMLATIDDLRRYLNTPGGGSASPAETQLLEDVLRAASSRFVELLPDRTLVPLPASDGDDPVAMTFPMYGRVVRVPDLRTVTALAIDGTAYAGTYVLRGRPGKPSWWLRFPSGIGATPGVVDLPAGYANGYDFVDAASSGDRLLTVTGYWGPAGDVEPHVREAVLIWAARVYQERAARWSDARQDPEGGVTSYFRSIPPAIKATIDSLRIPGL